KCGARSRDAERSAQVEALRSASRLRGRSSMSSTAEVLCAGILVADHVCTPISHLPVAGEVVMAGRLLLTVGGCAANAAVDLAKMGVRAGVVGRVGGDRFGRILAEMLAE